MIKTMLVVTPALARAILFHLVWKRDEPYAYYPFDLISHISTSYNDGFYDDGSGGKPTRMPVDVTDEMDANLLLNALKLAALDPVNPPNFKAACRRRAIQLALALGKSAVDIIAELGDAA